MANGEGVVGVDKKPMETQGGITLHLGSKGFFIVVFTNLEEQRQSVQRRTILLCCGWPLHATMGDEFCPRMRNIHISTGMDTTLLPTFRLLAA